MNRLKVCGGSINPTRGACPGVADFIMRRLCQHSKEESGIMVVEDIKKYITQEKMKRDTLVSFVILIGGLLLFTAMFLLARLAQAGGDLYHLFQNLGLFFLFASIALIYAAIHRSNTAAGDHTVRSLLRDAAKLAPVMAGILLGSIVALFIAALVELIPTLFGYIPYAGPVIVALLSLPVFLVNFALIAAMVMIWIVTPAMVAEGVALKKMPIDFYTLMKRRGLVIFGSAMIALAATLIVFGGVLMIIRYATGITRAVQWNIAPAYPGVFRSIIRPSYITDVITRIAPTTDPIATLQQYGTSIFNYIEMLGTLLKVIYGTALAAIASFVLGLFFNVMSFIYSRSKKDVI